MKPMLFSVAGAVLAVGAGVLAGCAGTQPASESHAAVAGMMCPECKTVWVTEPSRQGTKVSRLAVSREMICPDCDAMATSKLMGDGTVQMHNCPTCKAMPADLRPVERPEPRTPRKGPSI